MAAEEDDLPEGVYRCYRPKNFRDKSLKTIDQANRIIKEYEGTPISLRQLYYRFVARGAIDNTESSYDSLGSLISDARMAGLISWTAFEDRNRGLMGLSYDAGPAAAYKRMRDTYRIDLWRNQRWRPEVWVEKAALEGVVGAICNKLRIDYLALRGYNSSSEAWEASQRFAGYIKDGQTPIVFHLGDHDPSGLDMTRDNRERLELMTGTPISLQRLALNWPQIKEYDPPPNPAKMTDSRANAYVEKYGAESFELDSLPPDAIQKLIEDAVLMIRDEKLWEEMMAQEAHDKDFIDDGKELLFPTPKESTDEET